MTIRLDQSSPLSGPHFVRWPNESQLMELQRLLMESNLDFGYLAEKIDLYPGLSTHLMRRVNSINKGYGRRILSIRHALTLLGSNAIMRELRTATLMQSTEPG